MKIELTAKRLEKLLKAAKEAHLEFEKKTGKPDKNWPRWYSRYIISNLTKT